MTYPQDESGGIGPLGRGGPRNGGSVSPSSFCYSRRGGLGADAGDVGRGFGIAGRPRARTHGTRPRQAHRPSHEVTIDPVREADDSQPLACRHVAELSMEVWKMKSHPEGLRSPVSRARSRSPKSKVARRFDFQEAVLDLVSKTKSGQFVTRNRELHG